MSAPGGVCSGGCLLPGGSAPGGMFAPGGVSAPGGCLLRGGEVPPPPLLTESQTPVKT